MKKLVGLILPLFLIISICGCLDDEGGKLNTVGNKPTSTNLENNLNKSINVGMDNNMKKNITNLTCYKNLTNLTKNTTKNLKTKKYHFSKDVDMEKMFLNLDYDKEMKFDDKIIKKYKNITFVVSRKPEDFSNAYLYNEVKKYPQRDIYGNYYYYEFIPKNANLSISYCYYRKIGNYYIVMQTFEKSKRVSDLWVNWTKYIFSLFEE